MSDERLAGSPSRDNSASEHGAQIAARKVLREGAVNIPLARALVRNYNDANEFRTLSPWVPPGSQGR